MHRLVVPILFVLLAGFAVGSAEAQNIDERKPDECWTRTYSGAHLKKHKAQEVTAMELRLWVGEKRNGEEPKDAYMTLTAKLRDGRTVDSGLYCYENTSKKRSCSIECDGGAATVEYRTERGDLLLRNPNGLRLTECGDEEKIYFLDGPEHRIFKLFSCDAAAKAN